MPRNARLERKGIYHILHARDRRRVYATRWRRQRFQINLPRFLSIRLDSSLDPRAARERENFRPNIHVTYVNEERCRYVYPPRTRRHK